MNNPGMRPSWVVTDLMEVIGLGEFPEGRATGGDLLIPIDKETVETMIAPDLDNYTQESRLRSHLQVRRTIVRATLKCLSPSCYFRAGSQMRGLG